MLAARPCGCGHSLAALPAVDPVTFGAVVGLASPLPTAAIVRVVTLSVGIEPCPLVPPPWSLGFPSQRV
jgi:hypothetical protein